MFFRDSAAESIDEARARRGVVVSIVRFAAATYLVTIAAAAAVYSGVDGAPVARFARFAAYTAAAAVGFTAWVVSSVGLMKTRDGRAVASVGAANYLTIVRFLLIAPVVVWFAHGMYAAALSCYVVLGLTDVADGAVARRRGEVTEFGVVMDPLADVFSTAAIFALFLARDLVPAWVFSVLMVRYAMLFVGSFVLFLALGPIRFRSTTPGKVVGLIQAAGIVVVTACASSGPGGLEAVGPILFPILGSAFAAIVVSQGLIGVRHIRSVTRATREEARVIS